MNKDRPHHILNYIVVHIESSGKFENCENKWEFSTVATYKTNTEQEGSHMAQTDNLEATFFVKATKTEQYLDISGTTIKKSQIYFVQNKIHFKSLP